MVDQHQALLDLPPTFSVTFLGSSLITQVVIEVYGVGLKICYLRGLERIGLKAVPIVTFFFNR